MWIGKPAFDVANLIVFVLLVLSIIKLAAAQISRNVLLWIFFSLFILSVWSMTTMFWLTGSCNYMWMSLVQMIFLLPYVQALRTKPPKNFWLIIPLGLMAGWSNEAGALATICLTIFIIRLCKARRSWMTAGLVAAIIGCAFMILSPGNLIRMEFSHPHFHYSLEVFIDHLTTEFPQVVGANLIVLIPVAIYFLRRNFGRLNTSEILMLAFAAASFLVPVIMLFSPEFTLRVSITSMVFALVAASSAISELKINLSKISTALTALFVAYMLTLIYVDVTFYNSTQRQLEFIRQNAQVDCIALKPIDVSHRFEMIHGDRVTRYYMAHFGGIDTHADDCRNIMTSQFYKVKGLVAVE